MQTIEFKILKEFKDSFPNPVPASKAIPEWYKKIPKSSFSKEQDPKGFNVIMDSEGKGEPGHTIKECPPIRDYLCSGYIIPLWTDIFVEKTKESGELYSWRDGSREWIQWHSFTQVKGSVLVDDMRGNPAVYKLASPWYIKTPPGYSCLFFSPRYHKRKINILPAIVDTDAYHEVNFPFFYRGEDNDMINRGEPIIQVFPFKREDWKHKITTMDKVEVDKSQLTMQTFWSKAYKKLFHKKKVFR